MTVLVEEEQIVKLAAIREESRVPTSRFVRDAIGEAIAEWERIYGDANALEEVEDD